VAAQPKRRWPVERAGSISIYWPRVRVGHAAGRGQRVPRQRARRSVLLSAARGTARAARPRVLSRTARQLAAGSLRLLLFRPTVCRS